MEAVSGKEYGSNTLVDFREPPREAEGNWDSLWGHTCWWWPF